MARYIVMHIRRHTYKTTASVLSLTYLFTCGLFNDAARKPDCILLNDMMTMKEKIEKVR
jgi:hypothetical protein